MNECSSFLFIIDKTHQYKKFIEEYQHENQQFSIAETLELAQILIKDDRKSYNSIIFDIQNLSAESILLLMECHTYKPGVPIHLSSKCLNQITMYDNKTSINNLGIEGVFHSEEDILSIINLVNKEFKNFKFKLLPSPDGIDDGEDFVAVNAQNFICGNKSFFDVYVKIRERKYIKILNAGDTFETKRLLEYFRKGLSCFYIQREAQKHYLDFYTKLTCKIIEAKNISPQVKIKQTLQHGEMTFNFLKEIGVNSESLDFIISYSSNVMDLVDEIALHSKTVSLFTQNLAIFDHCVSTSLIAGLMGKALNYETSELIEVLGVSATLHDVGLYRIKNIYDEEEDREFLSEDEIENELIKGGLSKTHKIQLQQIYKEHPHKGAELLKVVPDMNMLIPTIISEHHERGNGTGFPNLVKKDQINPFSEIIGAADEFTKLIKRISQGKADRNTLNSFPAYLHCFSEPIQKSWIKTFIIK